MAAEASYVVAGCRPWSRRVFEDVITRYPGRWQFIARPSDLTVRRLSRLRPRYVFFLHWSWKVPSPITQRYACIAFHMTDLPYGRGGTPLQHLILRGHRVTKLTALRMTDVLDAGPIYARAPLSLAGNAEEIYARASRLAARMILELIRRPRRPVVQRGHPTVFRRRTPEQSAVPPLRTPRALYDFVRMLDADGYPRAFLTHAGFRYEFNRPTLAGGRIVAGVTITRAKLKDR